MAGVRYSGPNNSTLFSTCCDAAVCDDQACCPVCGEEIEPKDARSRHDKALRQQLGPDGYAAHRAHVARQIANDRAVPREEKER
jgi:hypothetical protein